MYKIAKSYYFILKRPTVKATMQNVLTEKPLEKCRFKKSKDKNPSKENTFLFIVYVFSPISTKLIIYLH